MSVYSLEIDAASLAQFERLAGFHEYLMLETFRAFGETATLLIKTAQDITWVVFANPTGQLASDIIEDSVSSTRMVIRVDSPYGMRREYGFSGMTDALGRYYPYDPGKPYMEPALVENLDFIRVIFEIAINAALIEATV